MRRFCVLLVLAFMVTPTIVKGAEPSAFTYSPQPPGSILESRIVYLAGEGMHSQWRAVLSRKAVGTGDDGKRFYQYYLSLYQIEGSTYRLRFQSPRDGGPFTAVTKANGANLWFPVQSARLVGTGEFIAPAVQQLVVQSHEMAADCGLSTVTVFAYDAALKKIVPSAVVTNYCDLQATVENSNSKETLRLAGPYYGHDAPLCCPTKPKAVATLRYLGGRWVQTPQYFPLKKKS
jgi:hypothetical protein